MPSITINRKNPDKSEDVRLTNGSLVILYDEMRVPIRSYLVTSFRGDLVGYRKDRSNYCTLIDLATGYPAFEEPASRSTTIVRIRSHIYREGSNGKISHQEVKPIKMFREMFIIPKDNYNLTITYSED